MNRRPLGELVAEMGEAVALAPARAREMRVTDLLLTLPLEVALLRDHSTLTFAADVPRWRWRTPFDREPGVLTLRLSEEIPQ